MADNKKYYYLKLKDSFFDSEEVKMIEAQENGYVYSNLYLKMVLLSLKDNGRLVFKGRIPYDEKMLSTITGIPLDSVRCGLKILKDFGLIEVLESGVMYMSDVQLLIGHGSSESERKAIYRKKIGIEKRLTGHCPGQVPPELELELELEKEIDIKKKKTKSFIKPTIEQIKQYCTERNNGIDAEEFYYSYEAKGWMIGKTKMKSWTASIITWEKSNEKRNKSEEIDCTDNTIYAK